MKPRSGVVLLLALLAIVALELTAAALHFTAIQQLRAARAGSRGLQLRLSAEGAAASAVRYWPASAVFATPTGGRLPVATATGEDGAFHIRSGAMLERLGDSLFLVRGEARSPLGETASVGLLVLAMDPVAQLPAVALRAGTSVFLGAKGLLAASAPGCDSAAAALELPDRSLLTAAPGARLEGDVSTRPDLQPLTLDGLLPSSLRQVLAQALLVSSSSLTPGPAVEGASCLTNAPGDRGEPLAGAASPCGTSFPVLRRDGDLRLVGGRGQGILEVTGDVVLSAGATFAGILIVGGRLTVTDGAAVSGIVLSLGGADILDGAVTGDRCALRRVLGAQAGVGGPYSAGARLWVPLF